MIQQFLVSCLYTYDGAMCFGSTSFFSRRCSWSSSVTEIVVLENRNEGFNQVPSRFRWLNFCLIVSQSADCTFLQMGVSMNHSKSKNQVKNWSILDIVVTQTAVVFQSLSLKYETLSVWWVLVRLVDIPLHIPDRITRVYYHRHHSFVHQIYAHFHLTWWNVKGIFNLFYILLYLALPRVGKAPSTARIQ